MDDYIRREDAIMTAMDYDGCGNAQDASQDIAADLASIPAADVRENVTAEWEERIVEDSNPLFRRRFYCSACGKWQTYGKTSFCMACGADMRG